MDIECKQCSPILEYYKRKIEFLEKEKDRLIMEVVKASKSDLKKEQEDIENCQKEFRSADALQTWMMGIEEGRKAGWNAAREKAKGIAKRAVWEWQKDEGKQILETLLTDRIGKMEPDNERLK